MNNIFLMRIFDAPEDFLLGFNSSLYTYAEMMDEFFEDGYGQANNIGKMLTENGFNSVELIPNYKKAQMQWLNENISAAISDENWKTDILELQIDFFKPEILLFVGWNYGGEYITFLKEKYSFLKKIIFWVGESLPSIEFLNPFDAILSCDRGNVTSLNKNGKQAFHINHAFDVKLNEKLNSNNKKARLSFIGSIKHGSSEHSNRCRVLYNLSRNLNVSLSGNVYPPKLYAKNFKGNLIECYHDFIELMENRSNSLSRVLPLYESYNSLKELREENKIFRFLKEKSNNPMFGIKYLQNLKDSQVVLNTHSNTDYACNMRLFESTGVGSCLLTDYKKNIHELFDVDYDIVCYNSTEELIDKANYLINNPEAAKKIAQSGFEKTKKNHVYSNRLPNYIEAINIILNG